MTMTNLNTQLRLGDPTPKLTQNEFKRNQLSVDIKYISSDTNKASLNKANTITSKSNHSYMSQSPTRYLS